MFGHCGAPGPSALSRAADVATAGDTVVIAGSNDACFCGGYNPYDENVTVTRSGRRSAPITCEAAEQIKGIVWGPDAQARIDWGDGSDSSGTYTVTATLTDSTQTLTRTLTVTVTGGA